MPAPILINTPSVLGQGLTTLGSTLTSIAQTYADKQKEERLKQEGLTQATTLSKIIQNADFSSPEGVKTFLSEASKSGIKIDPLQGAKMYQDAAANQIKSEKEKRTKDLYKSLGLGGEEVPATPQMMPQGKPQQNGQWQGAPFQLPQQGQGVQPDQITPQTQPVQQPQTRRFNDQQVTQMLASGDPALQKLAQNEMELRKIDVQEKTALKKDLRESYTINKDFINKTQDGYEAFLRKDQILSEMDRLDESGELSDNALYTSLDRFGLTPFLKNPANEEYQKLALDMLGGGSLQADYGNRILKSEFEVAMKRIPELNQTVEGRRQIKENIRAMMLPQKLMHDRMQFYIDQSQRTGEPLPYNLRSKILKDIQPQLEEAAIKFKERNGRLKVKQGTIPNDKVIKKYYDLYNGDVVKIRKLMQEDGYDVR